MVEDGTSLVTWIVETLKQRQDPIALVDPINEALVQLLTDIISFYEAIDSSILETFFDLIRTDSSRMDWLMNLVGSRLPQYILPRIHEYLILGLSVLGNPFLGSKRNGELSQEQANLIHMCDSLFKYLLPTHSTQVIDSVSNVLKHYIDGITDNISPMTETQKFTFGYLLCLSKISPNLLNESWSIMFNLLYENNTAGNIFYYEKTTSNSILRNNQGEIETIASSFSRWLTGIAFDTKGLIMSHAMDVMIMLDTLVHDTRLELSHLVPTGDKSILDTLQPSIKQLRLEPASVDLMDWIEHRTTINNIKIPLSLLQLALINNDSAEYAVNVFVQLIAKLSHASNLVIKLIPTAEPKWPGIFQ
ncbi:hypothetical protein G6F56_008474 [Rhizopus delemar]|nr:hypothetical protein G6F56_008474 [Rhizopus delemar]